MFNKKITFLIAIRLSAETMDKIADEMGIMTDIDITNI